MSLFAYMQNQDFFKPLSFDSRWLVATITTPIVKTGQSMVRTSWSINAFSTSLISQIPNSFKDIMHNIGSNIVNDMIEQQLIKRTISFNTSLKLVT